MRQFAPDEAMRESASGWRSAREESGCGSGVHVGLPHQDGWRAILQQLPLADGGHTVTTSAGDVSEAWAKTAGSLGHDVVCIAARRGGAWLGGLVHLLWWTPSVQVVLVVPGEAAGGATVDVAGARRAIELTGSDALLVVEGSAARGLDGLEQDARWADLVVVPLDAGDDDPRPTSLVAWSPRLASALAHLDLHPLSYDVLSRLGPTMIA